VSKYIFFSAALVVHAAIAEENASENTAFDPSPGECDWLDPVVGYVISGNDKKTLTNIEVNDCKQAGEEETGFNCYSIDYRKTDKTCFLQSLDRYSTKLAVNNNFDYHERNCRSKSAFLFSICSVYGLLPQLIILRTASGSRRCQEW
jgi:hypothetical protein